MNTFITTPIFYASGKPHLGHVYSAFVADALKRFYQLIGKEAFLITGTDENGQKIQRTADSSGLETQQFVDDKSLLFRRLWQQLGIAPDKYVRTTDLNHHNLVTAIWNKLQANGDIYIGTYEGRYCIDCEQYYSEWQLHDDCCPIHRKPVVTVSEPSYLFRLNKYREKLLQFYIAQPGFIQPHYFHNDLVRYLQQSKIEDLSISRTNTTWGIKVPNDEKHIIYVWFDALFSYLTALNDLEYYDQAIKDTIHVIGKDILQFHGIYWPAFLLAANLPIPKKLVVHGWWTLDGIKISKSNPTSLADPISLAELTTVDGLRYGLLRQKPLDRDGNLIIADLTATINSDLANNLGNLVNRFTTLVNKYFAGKIEWKQSIKLSESSRLLISDANIAIPAIFQAYSNAEFQKVCTLACDIVTKTNIYIHNRAPWKSANIDSDVVETLCVINAVLKIVCSVYYPIIPGLVQKIQHQLGQEDNALTWLSGCKLENVLVKKSEVIFNRIPG